MSGYNMVVAKVIEIHRPKADAVFTAERLEEHNTQRRYLQRTGHAELYDIHGTMITFKVVNHQERNRKVLRMWDTLGNSATEEIGPDDVFVTWFNTRFLKTPQDPDYGDDFTEMRKIQRYCPFEMGVWKNVPLGAGKNVFRKAEQAQSKEPEQTQSNEADSDTKPEIKEKQSPDFNTKTEADWGRLLDEKKGHEILVNEKALSLVESRRRVTFLQKTRRILRVLFSSRP